MGTQQVIQSLREYCLAKPGAFEDHPWGDTVFKVGPIGKIFCGCGNENARITVKSTLEKQAALILHPDIEIAAYVGRYGWVTLSVLDEQGLGLAFELIDESYSLVTKPRRKREGNLET